MNTVEAFRHFYEYNFAINRSIWDNYIVSLPEELFTKSVSYSQGSVQNQLLHLMHVEDAWFSDLRNVQGREWLKGEDFADRESIRAHWDAIEADIRTYLVGLRDDMLDTKPLSGEDKDLRLWQVLLHVVNHGTDHRAQILRLLSDLGVKTGPQDYIFYVYDHLV